MKRLPLSILMAAFFGWLLWSVSLRQAALFLVGIGLGAILAGQRFGFTTGWRMLVEDKDPRGVFGQLLLLALAAAMAMPLLGHYPELTAALGPPSISLLVGAFVFGLCMQIADGCGSGTLYKAGMGIPMNTAILPMFAIGSFLGSLHLGWWLDLGRMPAVGLVSTWGWLPALLATLAALAVIGWAVKAYCDKANAKAHSAQQRSTPGPWQRKWVMGAIGLAIFATLNLVIAGQPWGWSMALASGPPSWPMAPAWWTWQATGSGASRAMPSACKRRCCWTSPASPTSAFWPVRCGLLRASPPPPRR